MFDHPEFPTIQSLADRLHALPAHVVYGQLTSPEWGKGMDKYVPHHMRDSVVWWVALGNDNHLGGFLGALLRNDLMGALRKGDDVNAYHLRDWGMFLVNYTPSNSFGSPEKVGAYPGILRKVAE